MRLSLPVSEFVRRTALATGGLFVFAIGNYLTVQANVGQAPWNVFQLGLTNYLPMTYGQVSILVAFIVVAIDLLIREPIGLGTILDALLVGIFHDMFDAINLVPTIHNPILGVPVMLAGMVILAYSQYLYMSARFGCGPRDALLVGLGKRLRRMPIGLVSILLTAAVTCVGFLMGGSVGIGTVLFLLCNGAVMQLVFNLIHFEPRNLTHVGLHEMISLKK